MKTERSKAQLFWDNLLVWVGALYVVAILCGLFCFAVWDLICLFKEN